VSITLLAPRYPSPAEVPDKVKSDLDRIVFLMHQHLPVFRPSAGCLSLGAAREFLAGACSLCRLIWQLQ